MSTKTQVRTSGTNKWNFLQRMKLWQKFALLGTLALAAVAVPYARFFQSAQDGIDFARTEISGLAPAQSLTRIVQLVQQHRGLSALVLGGNEGQVQARAAKQAEVEQIIATLDKQLAGADSRALKESWVAVKQSWRQLSADVAGRKIDVRKSYDGHTAWVADSLVLLDGIGDLYKLTLDPNAHTYFLVQTALIHLPAMTEDFGQLRAFGAGRLAEGARMRASGADSSMAITAADRAQMALLVAAAERGAAATGRFLDKAAEAEPRLRDLQSEFGVVLAGARQLTQLTRKELIESPAPALDGSSYVRTYTEGMDSQFKFLARTQEVLGQELTQYADGLRRDQLATSAQVLAVTLLVAFVSVLTVRNITGTVFGLQRSVNKVREGDFAALQAIESQDEVGDLGRTVNDLLQDRIAAQKKAEQEKAAAEAENEALNNSVISILQAVNQLSQRDLTAKAPVTQDIIGTVSDSINALTDETSRVLAGVNLIAGQVADASGKVKNQGALVSKTAEDERLSVGRMIESLNESTQNTNQMAVLAEQSNLSAEQATQATDTALETVNGTVKGMEAIRETIAETEKRIKRLGERSQEITGIVNLINTISERTHVLALNASMQAAVAGEAGRGFAVVAEEVQRLAESSRNATQQIGTLVNNIQLETNETIATVSRTIGQVVQGSEQAQKAGDQMRRTQQITAQLVAQVRRIAAASEQQKTMSGELLKSVQHIGASNDRTAQQIDAQNVETETLLDSAKRLVASVAVFKLPQAA